MVMDLGFLLSTKVASLNGIGQLFLSKKFIIYLFIIYHDFGDLFQLCIDAEINKDSSSIPKRHIGPDYSMLSLSFHVCSQSPASFCILPGCPHISALFLGETYYCFVAEYQISVYDLQQNSKSSHFCY